MALDPRTPVIVGVGQHLHRTGTVEETLTPPVEALTLMEHAVHAAADDAGLDGPPAAQSVRVVQLLSWRYGNPARLLADRLGIAPAELALTTPGGNSPQMLVNRTALDIQSGDLDVAILVGGEAWRTRMRARRAEVELDWPRADPDDAPRVIGEDFTMSLQEEIDRGIFMPVQVYPMFETALRAAAGRSIDEHRDHLGRLYAGLSDVAAGNQSAWFRDHRSAEEITTPTAVNRMIGLPYPKLMNSNNDVDMAAAVIMCSVEAARRLGVPEDRWVFPHAGSDCQEHNFVSHRDTFERTPAIEIGGASALELADIGIDDVSVIDLYSCFPSAVQLGGRSLGVDVTERQWSRTGGLTFAGGPWNNYVMHAIAAVTDDLRERPGEFGFVWANGGLATKHSFGVYSTSPPERGFRHASPQDEVDALPRRDLAPAGDAAGDASVESYTVMFDRDGLPELAITTSILADGRRAWGTSRDADTTSAMTDGEWVGRTITLTSDGTIHLP